MKWCNAKMEKRLAKMRKMQIEFAAITDHMCEGLLVLDREAHVLSCNQSALRLLGARKERVERFCRVDKSRSAQIPGTGLGLSIVKHGAALHSAKVKLQSDGKSYTRMEIVFAKISFS
jgi:signal transduction histidine kinase